MSRKKQAIGRFYAQKRAEAKKWEKQEVVSRRNLYGNTDPTPYNVVRIIRSGDMENISYR